MSFRSVFTAMDCDPSTIKQNAGDTWTVSCTASYSDGSKWRGYASIVVAQGNVEWEPVSDADSGQ
jgi:hypothetical protein